MNVVLVCLSLLSLGAFIFFKVTQKVTHTYYVGIFAVLFFIGITLYRIGPQEVGVLVTPRGVDEETLHTGWHFVSPLTKVERMDKTVWVYTFSNTKSEGQKNTEDAIWTPTKDGIKIGLDLSVSWSIDPLFAPWILQNVTEQD